MCEFNPIKIILFSSVVLVQYNTELVSNELFPLKWEQQQTYITQHYKLVTHSSSVFALSDSRYWSVRSRTLLFYLQYITTRESSWIVFFAMMVPAAY